MLMILMYHRVGRGSHSNSLASLREHFSYIKHRYPVVLPGDPLRKGLNVCLTFDDATADFYTDAYPLLQSLQLPALLAVPVHLIGTAGYCTWNQLREMKGIEIASHSLNHLDLRWVDYEKEVVESKEILERELSRKVDTFVYPYGRTSPELIRFVNKHYPYSMRIGSALNFKWSPLLYRINGDALENYDSPFKNLVRPFMNYFVNTCSKKLTFLSS
ncbi:MAG: polysaccharide deacetylase family protein [Simkaniaceae bacterium]|nr:polysaccharide deacetylase family protein [Simkaniaceae bacterium]